MIDPAHHWPAVAALGSAVAAGAGLLGSRRSRGMAARWALWVALAATATFVVNVLVAYRRGWPEPRVHDEFSYLLAADTFAHARLTNSSPPAWPALQTFHVLLWPSYASKYPPGQGLSLALGTVLAGEPIVGAWLAAVALVIAVGWATAGVDRRAAVVAAALVAVHPQVVAWSQTYWGGSVAAIGGALLLGAWVRLANRGSQWRWRDACLLGVGLGVLANSRPFEGLAASIPVLCHLAARRPRALLAAGITFVPILCWTGYYNGRVTGSPWTMPYLAYEREYAAAPPLLIGSPRPVPAAAPADLRNYAEQVELPHYRQQLSLHGWATMAREKIVFLGGAVLPAPALWVVAALVPWAVAADRRLWMPAGLTLVALGATLLSNWTRTQYVAPATAAVAVLLAVATVRGGRFAPAIAGAVVVGAGLLSFGPTASAEHFQRADLLTSLEREPGRHLVLVRYLPGHRADDEWVYNNADPSSSRIVWARDEGDATAVRAAYPGRTVWHVDVDARAASVRRD